jgi:hypothetical protein
MVRLARREASSETSASAAGPSKKVTVPVGVMVPGPLRDTVAVRVTEGPKIVDLHDDSSVTVAAAAVMSNVIGRLEALA